MFGGKALLELPKCSIPLCDRIDGNFRSAGICHRNKWCEHARRDPSAVESYRNPKHFENQSVFLAVKPALEKLQRSNCRIAFWTTRPKTQTFKIIEALKTAEVWNEALIISGRNLLHIEDLPSDFQYSLETAKLSILEKSFGKDLSSGKRVIAIEEDPLEAAILKNYNPNLTVLLAPSVWLDIIAADSNEMQHILQTESAILPPGIKFRRTTNESPCDPQ